MGQAGGTGKADGAKEAAGRYAAYELVEPGMALGLGSGSTARAFVRALAERGPERLGVRCTATSRTTAELARELGIEVHDLDAIAPLDLTVDGCDEIDPQFRMIKGGGACLLWEKIVARASRTMVALADPSKKVETLGAFALPIEVVEFGAGQGAERIRETLAAVGQPVADLSQRMDGQAPLQTDSGHFIFDAQLDRIADPERLERALNDIAGVVENGLFTRECDRLVIGRADGTVEVLERAAG